MIPKIVERKIYKAKRKIKGRDYPQFVLTLPKEYAEELERRGIDSLMIIFDFGLGAFPKQEGATEEALRIFLNIHPELQQLFQDLTQKRASTNEWR